MGRPAGHCDIVPAVTLMFIDTITLSCVNTSYAAFTRAIIKLKTPKTWNSVAFACNNFARNRARVT